MNVSQPMHSSDWDKLLMEPVPAFQGGVASLVVDLALWFVVAVAAVVEVPAASATSSWCS